MRTKRRLIGVLLAVILVMGSLVSLNGGVMNASEGSKARAMEIVDSIGPDKGDSYLGYSHVALSWIARYGELSDAELVEVADKYVDALYAWDQGGPNSGALEVEFDHLDGRGGVDEEAILGLIARQRKQDANDPVKPVANVVATMLKSDVDTSVTYSHVMDLAYLKVEREDAKAELHELFRSAKGEMMEVNGVKNNIAGKIGTYESEGLISRHMWEAMAQATNDIEAQLQDYGPGDHVEPVVSDEVFNRTLEGDESMKDVVLEMPSFGDIEEAPKFPEMKEAGEDDNDDGIDEKPLPGGEDNPGTDGEDNPGTDGEDKPGSGDEKPGVGEDNYGEITSRIKLFNEDTPTSEIDEVAKLVEDYDYDKLNKRLLEEYFNANKMVVNILSERYFTGVFDPEADVDRIVDVEPTLSGVKSAVSKMDERHTLEDFKVVREAIDNISDVEDAMIAESYLFSYDRLVKKITLRVGLKERIVSLNCTSTDAEISKVYDAIEDSEVLEDVDKAQLKDLYSEILEDLESCDPIDGDEDVIGEDEATDAELAKAEIEEAIDSLVCDELNEASVNRLRNLIKDNEYFTTEIRIELYSKLDAVVDICNFDLDDEDKDEDIKDEEDKDEDIKDEEDKDEDIKDEEDKDEDIKDDEDKDEGNKDEGNKDEDIKDEEDKDEDIKDEGNKDEDIKDEEDKDEDIKDEDIKDDEDETPIVGTDNSGGGDTTNDTDKSTVVVDAGDNNSADQGSTSGGSHLPKSGEAAGLGLMGLLVLAAGLLMKRKIK